MNDNGKPERTLDAFPTFVNGIRDAALADHLLHGVDHALGRERAGVDEHRVGRLYEGRGSPGAVAAIPLDLIREDLVEGDRVAKGAELGVAAPRPDLRIGDEEELGLGAREDDRADVAPLGNDATGVGEAALEREERLAHRRVARHPR